MRACCKRVCAAYADEARCSSRILATNCVHLMRRGYCEACPTHVINAASRSHPEHATAPNTHAAAGDRSAAPSTPPPSRTQKHVCKSELPTRPARLLRRISPSPPSAVARTPAAGCAGLPWLLTPVSNRPYKRCRSMRHVHCRMYVAAERAWPREMRAAGDRPAALPKSLNARAAENSSKGAWVTAACLRSLSSRDIGYNQSRHGCNAKTKQGSKGATSAKKSDCCTQQRWLLL